MKAHITLGDFKQNPKFKGKLISSYRMPQFFQRTDEQEGAKKIASLERQQKIITDNRLQRTVADPDELMAGMSEYL